MKVDELKQAITDRTILVSIGHANSEIGTLQPLKEIGTLLKKHGILFHSDCVQTFGKIPIDVEELGLDSLSISSHKLYGPKGVGACYISPNVSWEACIPGTTHERGFRAGTVNVPAIAAFVTAAEDSIKEMENHTKHYWKLRDRLLVNLERNEQVIVEGRPLDGLPSIIGFRVRGIEGQYLMLELNRRGFAVSTGSACAAGKQSPSKTMLAIGRSPDEARGLIRVSLGIHTTLDDIDAFLLALEESLEKMNVTYRTV